MVITRRTSVSFNVGVSCCNINLMRFLIWFILRVNWHRHEILCDLNDVSKKCSIRWLCYYLWLIVSVWEGWLNWVYPKVPLHIIRLVWLQAFNYLTSKPWERISSLELQTLLFTFEKVAIYHVTYHLWKLLLKLVDQSLWRRIPSIIWWRLRPRLLRIITILPALISKLLLDVRVRAQGAQS